MNLTQPGAIRQDGWQDRIRFTSVASRFLAIFLPLVLLVVSCAGFIIHFERRNKVQIEKLRQYQVVEQARQRVLQDIKSAIADAQLLTQLSSLKNATDGLTPSALAMLESDWLLFAKNRSHYTQIRYIDVMGMEVVRIESREGSSRALPHRQLQFKGHRSYFLESFSLAADEMYISPFDLNIEYGSIEKPFRPMVRYEKPINDRRGYRKGVLVINCDTRGLLSDIRGFVDKSIATLVVTNADGYFLIGPDPAMEWGHVVKERSHSNLRETNPQLWESITRHPDGQRIVDGSIVTHATIYPPVDSAILDTAGTGSARPIRGATDSKDPSRAICRIVTTVNPMVYSTGGGKGNLRYGRRAGPAVVLQSHPGTANDREKSGTGATGRQ